VVPPQRRQVCWAHLRRDSQAMVDRDDAGWEVGQELLNYSDVVFEYLTPCWEAAVKGVPAPSLLPQANC
jgi:hypothetical protein